MKSCLAIVCGLQMVLLSTPVLGGGDIFEFDGNKYGISDTGAMWSDASAIAQASFVDGVPGHLCIINSAEEDAKMFEQMEIAGVETSTPNGGGARYMWLGGADVSTSVPGAIEGEFYWVDGSQFWTGGMAGAAFGGAYSNFGRPQEPDNFGPMGQHHLAMARDSWPVGNPSPFGDPGQWNDVNSEDLRTILGYCIEYELQIFADDFESQDTSEWSDAVP